MSIAESIWQSLLSQGTAIAVLIAIAYLFRDAILRFINDKISLASKKELQSREHEFIEQTYFDTILSIQKVTSSKVHENAYDGWTSGHVRLILAAIKEVLHELYVVPGLRAERLIVLKLGGCLPYIFGPYEDLVSWCQNGRCQT